jgi:hypothetical protein
VDIDILSVPKFVTFLAWQAGTISRYSAGESPPIKAGQPEATPHLATACKGIHIIRETKEIVSEVWEKSAVVDSAEPNSKGILLHLCQHFVNANIFSTPTFCQRQYFVDTNILSIPIIFRVPIFCPS